MDSSAPVRIYQWGSLLRREPFSEISDIDLAVEGLDDSGSFFILLSEADEMSDLLHAESIVKKGKLIYERPK